ncbi:hypothetical protein PVAP13_2NG560300 [Panicum virgatum]|uniref:Uncharacterized protein n=1 Tax=Panicum virgatum TaxID=38727 RepID=A0A8T0VWI9_PANVG|nr:hypothetical protein PVAP13_2NG560300 [Panicum virgatum]
MVSRGAVRPQGSRLREQEMNIDECVRSLRNRIRRLHPFNADGIVSYMISSKTPVEIRQYLLASDDQIQRLIVEAKYLFPMLPPPQPPCEGAYIPYIHWQPQFHPSGSYHGIQDPVHPINQVGPLQQHQYHPSGSSHGIQAQNPSGPTGACQSPFPGFIGLGEHFQSFCIPGDGLPSNYGNACQVTGYPSSSKEQIKPCHFLFSTGSCKKGENCLFSHGSDSPKTNSMRQVQTPESLPMLEKEISELLLSLRPPKVPVESLANIYIKRYGKPLKFGDSCTKGQQNDHSFTCLLTKLCTTRVIERQGQCYIVPLEEAPKYLDDGFKLVMSPAGNGSDQIYITFGPKSTFTKEDAWNYFSQYGPVNDVRIPLRKKRMFGYVIFLYPGTAKRVLSERSPRNPHFICGDQVFVKAWKEKHELEKLAEKDAHSNSGANNASGLSSVIHEHQTGDDSTAESSPVQSHLDEAPAARDSDDLGLPGTLDDIY